jgi:hypothetical protein
MRLKPRRKIWGLADDCLLLGRMFADQVAHDDRAGGDANADMKVNTDVGLNGGHDPDQRQSRARRLAGGEDSIGGCEDVSLRPKLSWTFCASIPAGSSLGPTLASGTATCHGYITCHAECRMPLCVLARHPMR